MAKNVRHNMRQAIFNSFREGMNKHSIKRETPGRIGVFSYGTRANLLDTTDVFCAWLKDQGIKREDQITAEVIEAFLKSKANEGCSNRTLQEYRSRLHRIGVLMGYDWRCKVIESGIDGRPDRGCDSVISKADFDQLLAYCAEHPSKSAACILLEHHLGVRVGDLCYGTRIDQERGVFCIRGKANKLLERPLTPEVEELLTAPWIKDMFDENGKFLAPKDDTVNTFLRRFQKKYGLERHSFHDLRRFKAQEHYDAQRAAGLTRMEAASSTGVYLNHGPHREKMAFDSYIGKAW